MRLVSTLECAGIWLRTGGVANCYDDPDSHAVLCVVEHLRPETEARFVTARAQQGLPHRPLEHRIEDFMRIDRMQSNRESLEGMSVRDCTSHRVVKLWSICIYSIKFRNFVAVDGARKLHTEKIDEWNLQKYTNTML